MFVNNSASTRYFSFFVSIDVEDVGDCWHTDLVVDVN